MLVDPALLLSCDLCARLMGRRAEFVLCRIHTGLKAFRLSAKET